MSTSLSWTSLFSLFSLACSRFLSLWQRGVAFRALSGVGLEGCPFSTDGDTSLFKNTKRQMMIIIMDQIYICIWDLSELHFRQPESTQNLIPLLLSGISWRISYSFSICNFPFRLYFLTYGSKREIRDWLLSASD